jgi:hypothetical protein
MVLHKSMCISSYYKRERQNFIILLVLFFLFPFVSLPIVFRRIYEGKKYALHFLAIFMGLLSVYYFPFGDQYRYLEKLNLYSSLSFGEVFDIESIFIYKNLNLVNVYVFVASKLNLTLEFIRFTLIVSCYLLVFSVYENFVQDKYDLCLNDKWIRFLILYLSVPFFFICFGFRTGMGGCFLIYGISNLINGKRMKAFVGILFSVLCHILFLIYVAFIMLIINRKNKISRKVVFLFSFVVVFASFWILNSIYGKIELLDVLMDQYIYGDWGEEYEWSFFTVKVRVFLGGAALIYMYMIFFLSPKQNVFLWNLLCLNFCLFVFSIPFYTFIERLVAISLPILVLYVIKYKKMLPKYRLNIVLFLLLVSFLSPFYIYRYQYGKARIEEIVFCSFPVVLTNTYDIDYVNDYVDDEGLFIVNKY